MAQRPTVSDLAAWLDIPAPEEDSDASLTPLDEVFAAALEGIEDRVTLPEGALDEGSDGPSDLYPSRVRTAVLMYGGRLYRRRASPEGLTAFGPDGPVRIVPIDSDIEQLIERYLRMDGFA